MSESSNRMTQTEAREYFSYNKQSGILTWRKRPSQCVKLGERAGYARPNGRRVVRFKGRNFYEHRIIWLLVTGAWPQDEIDHANRKKGDNRWDNLRDANQHQNAGNRDLYQTNTSGVRGVSYHKAVGRWVAYIRKGERQTHLGSFKTKAEAAAISRGERQRYFGEFFNG